MPRTAVLTQNGILLILGSALLAPLHAQAAGYHGHHRHRMWTRHTHQRRHHRNPRTAIKGIDHDPLAIGAQEVVTPNQFRVIIRSRVVHLRGGSQTIPVTVTVNDPGDSSALPDIRLVGYVLKKFDPSGSTSDKLVFKTPKKSDAIVVADNPTVDSANFTVTFSVTIKDTILENDGKKQKIYLIAYKDKSSTDPTPLDDQVCVNTLTAVLN